MSIHGPCVVCGKIDYELSCGGPTICPACDCGYTYSKARVQDLEKEIAFLKSRIEHGPEVSREFVEQVALSLETFIMPDRCDGNIAPFEFITNNFLIPMLTKARVTVIGEGTGG